MTILGIDYGRAKIGLASSRGPLAEPMRVIRVNSTEDAIEKVKQVVREEKVDKIVVGISEGQMGEETRNFSISLSKSISIPVETFDETLSTYEAQQKSIQSGVSRKKRREMEDAYAAAIMLQNYIDSTS